VAGLSARQRLDVALRWGWLRKKLEGDIYCDSDRFGLAEYRLVGLTDTSARFQKIGDYKPTLLDTWFGGEFFLSDILIENGLLYVTHITVFNTRGPHPLREVGHFAAPGLQTIYPLADGRTIVGGTGKLWLIGPPPKRE
jgi:hypothetical protein